MNSQKFLEGRSSHFRQLARLITVSDICSSFIATFDISQPVEDIFSEWGVSLCGERGLDPEGQIALVTQNGIIRGWLGFDMLVAGREISKCMDSIKHDMIVSADTSLVDAVATFSTTVHPFFFVLKGNQFIGWMSYDDLHKPPLRLCLFAMLINIERLLLGIASLVPSESLQCLSEGRLRKAREVYKARNYEYNVSVL